MHELARLGAPDIEESRTGGDRSKRLALAQYLSDWHLIAFLGTTQLVSEEDMVTLIRTMTSPNFEDSALLDPVITSASWQTLMTFTRESVRKYHTAGPVCARNDIFRSRPPILRANNRYCTVR
jgi:nuclear protein localization protein 4 homolog